MTAEGKGEIVFQLPFSDLLPPPGSPPPPGSFSRLPDHHKTQTFYPSIWIKMKVEGEKRQPEGFRKSYDLSKGTKASTRQQ